MAPLSFLGSPNSLVKSDVSNGGDLQSSLRLMVVALGTIPFKTQFLLVLVPYQYVV